MAMARRVGLTLARLAGLVMVIFGVWAFAGSIRLFFTSETDGSGFGPWVLPWILGTGLAGAFGGVFYLLSIDGPERFRTKRTRWWSWAGMMLGALVPSIVALFLLLIVLLTSPTLFLLDTSQEAKRSVTET